jgi:hypothetical protein
VKSKNTRLLNRREFSGLCVALSSFVISPGASALDAGTDVASTGAGRTVRFRDGTVIPALGQGSAGLGKGRHPQADEEEALRTGLSLGMTLIDTADPVPSVSSPAKRLKKLAAERSKLKCSASTARGDAKISRLSPRCRVPTSLVGTPSRAH